MRLTTAGTAVGLEDAIVGKVATKPVGDSEARKERVFVTDTDLATWGNISGYRALLTTLRPSALPFESESAPLPMMHSVREIDHIREGDIVVLQPRTGLIRTLYRPDSMYNVLFVTERCNSNCLMCSQPPKDRDDTEHFIKTNLELIRLIGSDTAQIGITGGEPTLLREGLFSILESLRDMSPNTHVHMLTNGRMFAWPEFTARLAGVRHPSLVLGIPLYSDFAAEHDYVVQAKDAFDQTVTGLHQLARWNIKVEIRVVLHRVTIPRLLHLAEYIYRNFPFAVHVALMGLEMIGYVRRNLQDLWIDPADYQQELEDAVEFLSVRGMNVSIYNHQLCILRRGLWKFARKSISDWKNIYLEECQVCSVLEQCGGLFKSAEKLHSKHISALPSQIPQS